MKIFTVTENKIKYWDKIRDIEDFKNNLEYTYNIKPDYYIIEDTIDFYSINFTNFEVVGNEIIFKFSVYKECVKQDYVGFPCMSDEEIDKKYNLEQKKLIKEVLNKYSLQDCKLWDKFIHLNMNPLDYGITIPEDFPKIPRVLLDFITDELSFDEVARVKVKKYEF